MSEQNLLSIGSILAAFLGSISLYLVMENKQLRWNERLAGLIISWIFIAKAIGNGNFSVLTSIFESSDGSLFESDTMWQFWWSMGHMSDYVFTAGITLLSLIFPITVLRTKTQLKIGLSLIVFLMIYWPVTYSSLGPTWLEFAGFVYLFPALVWTSTYVRFRMLQVQEEDINAGRIADVSAMLLLLLNGHIWFFWVGMFAQEDYFYFVDIAAGWSEAGSAQEYIWQMFYTLSIASGLFIAAFEIYILQRTGTVSPVGIIVCAYMCIGIVGFFVLTMGEADQTFILASQSSFKDIWRIFTNQTHFTIARPLIATFILLNFGIIDVSTGRNMKIAKGMAVILIVVATAALLEMVQFIIPVDQTLSAGLLGIVVAVGIGWEERTFDKVVQSRVRVDDLIAETGFEALRLELPESVFTKGNYLMLVYFLILLLLSYINNLSNLYINTW
tara:strand:+ start:5867 stop:7198 length:1332 start_codon:yes stop_codon:yes gene_type:complete